jgi:hypothetical protein
VIAVLGAVSGVPSSAVHLEAKLPEKTFPHTTVTRISASSTPLPAFKIGKRSKVLLSVQVKVNSAHVKGKPIQRPKEEMGRDPYLIDSAAEVQLGALRALK